jgi:hypothetical protein
MQPLPILVKTYFPGEVILNTNKIKLTDTWKNSLSGLVLSWRKGFYLQSMDMIETNKKYYFDRRQPFLFQSQTSALTGPLLLSTLCFLYLSFIHTPFLYSLSICTVFFSLWLLISLWNIKINQGLVNILTIDKEWVQKVEKKQGSITILGTLPSQASYTFVAFLPWKVQNKLSLTEKLFSGLYFGRHSLPISATFTFHIQTV